MKLTFALGGISRMKTTTIAGLLVGLVVTLLLPARSIAQAVEKNKFRQVEVTTFEIQDGVQFPTDYLAALTEQLVIQLKDTKKFAQVLQGGEKAIDGAGPTLRLSGTVTEYQAGNRAARYLVGFGAGKTKIVAHVKFIDSDTGAVLVEKDVDGKVLLGGAVMGAGIGATSGLAKEVAKLARQRFF